MKPLKLPDRAEVTADFVDLMILIYTNWLTTINNLHLQEYSLKRYAPFIQRILPIIRRQSHDLHTGLDYEITRLRGNPYVLKFTTFEHNGVSYLVGMTRDITLTYYVDNHIYGYLGKYRIYISTQVFSSNDMRFLHMIPEGNPYSVYRHPHHYIDHGYDKNHLTYPTGTHPLDATTGNCWGSFSAPVKGSIDNPDIPVLFSLLGKHLSTFGQMPPIKMEQLDFPWRLQNENNY